VSGKEKLNSHIDSLIGVLKSLALLLPLLLIAPKLVNATPLTVAVTIVPQKYFVDQIGKSKVKVMVMVPPGANPHSYEPRPQQMIALSKAKIYLTIGVEFERAWLGKIIGQNKNIKVFHMEEDVKRISLPTLSGRSFKNSPRDDFYRKVKTQQTKTDPHIWLSPPLAKKIAENTARALVSADPENAEFYRHNLESLITLIEEIDREIRNILRKKKGCAFLVLHPAWGYFARRYDLLEVPIEIEGKEPSPKELKEIVQFARKRRIRAILVEPQFSEKIARIIAQEIKAKLVPVDPLAYDWPVNMIKVARIIAEISK